MTQRFGVGDRVIAMDVLSAWVPRGTLGTVVWNFVLLPDMCEVQFDGHTGVYGVHQTALASASTLDAPPPARG